MSDIASLCLVLELCALGLSLKTFGVIYITDYIMSR